MINHLKKIEKWILQKNYKIMITLYIHFYPCCKIIWHEV